MYKYLITIGTGFAGAEHEEVVESVRPLSEEELSEYANEMIADVIHASWEEIDDEDDEDY